MISDKTLKALKDYDNRVHKAFSDLLLAYNVTSSVVTDALTYRSAMLVLDYTFWRCVVIVGPAHTVIKDQLDDIAGYSASNTPV